MKTAFALLLAFAALLPVAQAQTIDIRLSVKVILHPTTGERPFGITDDRIRESVTNANTWMTRFSRGYRYRIDEILEIGGPDQGGSRGPSQFFGLGNDDFPTNFQQIVNSDSRFLLRSDMVNLLSFRSFQTEGGGACPVARDIEDTNRITCRIIFGIDPWTLCHELGHFFGLNHTFGGCGCDSGTNCVSVPGGNGGLAGDDGLDDTLPDRGGDCASSLSFIAYRQYGIDYPDLNSAQQTLVRNTYYNVMSYHSASRDNGVMTVLQLDRTTDIANGIRRPFVTGRTLFLSPAGLNGSTNGFTSAVPRRTFAGSTNLTASNGRDIMMLRHGNYPEAITFRRPVTLRTPMAGSATIGKP